MLAITQADYYLTLLKYLTVIAGGIGGVFIFFGIVYGIVVYSRYWR